MSPPAFNRRKGMDRDPDYARCCSIRRGADGAPGPARGPNSLQKRRGLPNVEPMQPGATVPNCNWLRTGSDVFPAMLAAIAAARRSVRLETYIYAPGPLGERFREALVRARQTGAKVQVLIDALGSYNLPSDFWKPLLEVGGEMRWFNPLSLNRLGFRNHRKLLVCDETVAFIGGFNIAPEYRRGRCQLRVVRPGLENRRPTGAATIAIV